MAAIRYTTEYDIYRVAVPALGLLDDEPYAGPYDDRDEARCHARRFTRNGADGGVFVVKARRVTLAPVLDLIAGGR